MYIHTNKTREIRRVSWKPRVFKQNPGFGNSDQYIFWEPSNREALFRNTSNHKPL